MDEILNNTISQFKQGGLEEERVVDFVIHFSAYCHGRFGGTVFYWRNTITDMLLWKGDGNEIQEV